MLPYWLLFLVLAFAAFSEKPGDLWRSRDPLPWLLIWLLLTVLIGFRYQVGGDWGSYEKIFRQSSFLSFGELLLSSDPGYILLNWLAAKAGLGIVSVNVVCAAVFAWGLVAFAREQSLPWLAIVVAVPYLVTVVAMGYSRQAVAIGFAMLAFTALGANSAVRFAAWITVAALFHKSAIVIIPVAILAKTSGRAWTAVWIGTIGVLLYYLLVAESIDAFIVNYIEAEYQSQGAAIRVTMNALPAAAFLIYRRYFMLKGAELNLWTYLSLGALGFVVLFFVSPSSTAVDRIALYLIPVQIFVLSRLPLALHARYETGEIVRIGVLGYSVLVLFVWLTFATHAQYWLPYQMKLFSE